MRELRAVAVALVCALMTPLASAAPRIVALGGAVTEILFAIGAGEEVVAVDSTSIYPAAADALPDVGYVRTLSAEPIIAFKPALVLYEQAAGPPETLAQLAATGVKLVAIPDAHSVTGVADKIRAVAAAVQREEAGARLVASLEHDMAQVGDLLKHTGKRPRVLFAMQFDQGAVMAAGRGTAADAIIQMAGGENVGAPFDGYKSMGGEALLAAAPDIILTMERAVAGFKPQRAVLDLPCVRLTPAASAGRLVVMDGLLLLGFGPRLGTATRQLAEALHIPP